MAFPLIAPYCCSNCNREDLFYCYVDVFPVSWPADLEPLPCALVKGLHPHEPELSEMMVLLGMAGGSRYPVPCGDKNRPPKYVGSPLSINVGELAGKTGAFHSLNDGSEE